MKKICIFLVVLTLLAFVVGAAACNKPRNKHTLLMLTADGNNVVDSEGDKIMLRGLNASGI